MGGQGLTVELQQLDVAKNVLVTTTLVSDLTAYQDFTHYVVDIPTTHASAAYFVPVVRLEESTGKISVSDIRIEEVATEIVTNPAVASFCETGA